MSQKEAIVVAALVLAVAIPSSRHAYVWLRRISANKQINVNGRLDHPEDFTAAREPSRWLSIEVLA